MGSRLYPEMPKGAYSEHGFLFGNEQGAQPGELHTTQSIVAARGATQAFAYKNASYNPSAVDQITPSVAASQAIQQTDMQSRRSNGVTSSGLPPLGGGSNPAQRFMGGAGSMFQGSSLFQGSALTDPTATSATGPGSGAGAARSFTPPTFKGSQLFQGSSMVPGQPRLVAEPSDEGQSVQPEQSTRGEQQRRQLSPDWSGDNGGTATQQVNNLGELEPRMNKWGHELSQRQPGLIYPPGPRTLAHKDEVVATQAGDLQGVWGKHAVGAARRGAVARANAALGEAAARVRRGCPRYPGRGQGVGDLGSSHDQRLMEFYNAQDAAIKTNAAAGNVQGAINAAAVTPWQNTSTGVTQAQVNALMTTSTGYQEIASKIQNALAPTGTAPVALPTSIPIALPTAAQAAQIVPTAPTTPIAPTITPQSTTSPTVTPAPAALSNVVGTSTTATVPVATGTLPIIGYDVNGNPIYQGSTTPIYSSVPFTPGSTATAPYQIPLPGAPLPPTGGGDSGGSTSQMLAGQSPTTAATVAPAAPAPTGLSALITLPLIGAVPLWAPIAGAAALLYFRSRKKKEAAAAAGGTKTNPRGRRKRNGKRKRNSKRRKNR
jgi:hypothetical protein